MHPIAGRCKHCKADLAAQRGARPAAAAALPALRHGNDAPAPAPAPYTPGPPDPARPPIVAVPHVAEDSRPILPPRPTGRMEARSPRASIWRNWPVIVIVLASLAIATAVVLMVYPTSSSAKTDSRRLPPPPAPERMDTNPLPPQPPSTNGAPPKRSGIDPWSTPDPRAAPTPADPDTIDPDDLAIDPFNGRGGGTRRIDPFGGLNNPFGGLTGQSPFMFTILEHACTRAKSCSNRQSQLTQMCEVIDVLGTGGTAPTCASGQRCLARIDQLDCDDLDNSDPMKIFGLAKDCFDAIQSC